MRPRPAIPRERELDGNNEVDGKHKLRRHHVGRSGSVADESKRILQAGVTEQAGKGADDQGSSQQHYRRHRKQRDDQPFQSLPSGDSIFSKFRLFHMDTQVDILQAAKS